MSLRLSIGATRARLVQKMSIESVLLRPSPTCSACCSRASLPLNHLPAGAIHKSRLSRVAHRLAIVGVPLHCRRADDHALRTRTGTACVARGTIGGLRRRATGHVSNRAAEATRGRAHRGHRQRSLRAAL
jgi:hypothetical protein